MLSYTLDLKSKVDAADGSLIGVQLGKFCIANNIPVYKIAQQFSVSRMTVYHWFKGEVKPHKSKHPAIQKFISIYNGK
jgi:hypothetical protein